MSTGAQCAYQIRETTDNTHVGLVWFLTFMWLVDNFANTK